MVLELLTELMTTTWGQVAVIGTSLVVFSTWLLFAWEATVVDSKERVTYDRDLPPRPYVKVKSFRTFEDPFQMQKLNEVSNWDMWCDLEWSIRGACNNLVTMIRETISDFCLWSKTNKMFYIGTLGFAGTYYVGVLAFTNPTIISALKSIGTAPYLLLAMMIGVVIWEWSNNKGEKDERREEPSVEIQTT